MNQRITPEESGVWRLRATINKKAETSKDDRFFIPSFDTGKTYSSQYIAVGVQVNGSKDNWRHGGYLSQEFKFPSVGYSNGKKAFNKLPDLLINEVSILTLPLLSEKEYKLQYFPPTYFTDLRLQIWEYTGTTVNLLIEDLSNFFRNAPPDLLVNLPSIESKIDRILTNKYFSDSNFENIEQKVNLLLYHFNIPLPTKPQVISTARFKMLRWLRVI